MTIFTFAFLIGLSNGESLPIVLSISEVNDLIIQIKDAENRLANIKVEAEVWTEHSDSDLGLWKRGIGYGHATTWVLSDPNERPDGRARIDVHTEITESYWIDQSRFIVEERSYTSIYDGKQGRVIHYHETPDGRQTKPLKLGLILAQRPTIPYGWLNHVLSGFPFTLQGHFLSREDLQSFSRFFEHSITYGGLTQVPGLEFSRELYDDISCIRFGTKGHPSARVSYWFDPNRGYALMGHESVSISGDGTEFVNERIRITKLQEVAEGIWWPEMAIIETDRRDERKKDKPCRRTIFRAIEVTVNDSKFDESIFNVSFPAGYTVEDKINNRTYVVQETPK